MVELGRKDLLVEIKVFAAGQTIPGDGNRTLSGGLHRAQTRGQLFAQQTPSSQSPEQCAA